MRGWWWRVERRWSRWRGLGGVGGLADVLHISVVAALAPLLLRLKPARLQALLEPAAAPPFPDPARIQGVQGRIDAVLEASVPFVRSRCTTRGVTRYYFLRRLGLDVRLCFGAGFVDGEFAAHCWLVLDGEPYLETEDPRPHFRAMYTIPTPPFPGTPSTDRSGMHGTPS